MSNQSIRKISVCFPAYNEERNIPNDLKECLSLKRNSNFIWEFVIVDDGSKDKTGEIVKEFVKKDKSFVYHKHEKNLGYASAFRSCLQKATGDVIFVIDADGQYDLKEYKKFIDAIKGGYDFASGYRKKIGDSSYRVLLSGGYNIFFRLLFGTDYKDIDVGFKAFRKDVAKEISKKIKYERMPVGAEIFAWAIKMNLKIKIIPVKHLKRKWGGTRIYFPWKMPVMISKIFYNMLKLKLELVRSK